MVNNMAYLAYYCYPHGLISCLPINWQLVLYIREYPPVLSQVSLKPKLLVYPRYDSSGP